MKNSDHCRNDDDDDDETEQLLADDAVTSSNLSNGTNGQLQSESACVSTKLESSTTTTTATVAAAATTTDHERTGLGLSAQACRLVSFFALVAVNVSTQIAFKLSQRGGSYQYNTMSAMCVVEFIKLLISLVHYHKEHENHPRDSPTIQAALKNVAPAVYRTYALLALSYAVYNQLVFAVMKVADPGTFSLLKSFTTFIVSMLNFGLFGEALTQLQWLCVLIQIFGIIPVITTSECTLDPADADANAAAAAAAAATSMDDPGANTVQLSFAAADFFLMVFCCTMASLNTVYNAAVVKKVNVPVSLQNIMLYSFGVAINTLFYFVYSTDDRPFFYGYGHWGVWLLLTLNSFIGIAITMIYKYGDAVLKTLTSPLAASILVYISYLFFDLPLDIVKAAGAGVVVVDTLLYLKLPSAPTPPKQPAQRETAATEDGDSSSTRTQQDGGQQHHGAHSRTVMVLTLLFAIIGSTLIGSRSAPGGSGIFSSATSPIANSETTIVTSKNQTAVPVSMNKEQALEEEEEEEPKDHDSKNDSGLRRRKRD